MWQFFLENMTPKKYFGFDQSIQKDEPKLWSLKLKIKNIISLLLLYFRKNKTPFVNKISV